MDTVTNILLQENIDHAQSAVKQLLFMVASARVRGGGCLYINYAHADTELEKRIGRAVRQALSRMKKKGEIQLFLTAAELDSERTEARYLLEKCPSLKGSGSDANAAFYAYI